jgi:hypothetical protein
MLVGDDHGPHRRRGDARCDSAETVVMHQPHAERAGSGMNSSALPGGFHMAGSSVPPGPAPRRHSSRLNPFRLPSRSASGEEPPGCRRGGPDLHVVEIRVCRLSLRKFGLQARIDRRGVHEAERHRNLAAERAAIIIRPRHDAPSDAVALVGLRAILTGHRANRRTAGRWPQRIGGEQWLVQKNANTPPLAPTPPGGTLKKPCLSGVGPAILAGA